MRERIGEEVSERYHYEAPKVWVERHVYPKYACGHCHQGVTVAAAVKTILPKANASASLLAHVVTSKFDDGLPIFRICRQLERQDVRLSPGTVGTWVNTVGAETVMPLINLMADDLLAEPVVQMDESVPRTWGGDALRCCGEDEGWVPRGRLSEGDLKPPTAAVSKRHGGERVGKAAARPRQVRIKEMSVSKPLVDVSKIARCCRNQCHFVPLG